MNIFDMGLCGGATGGDFSAGKRPASGGAAEKLGLHQTEIGYNSEVVNRIRNRAVWGDWRLCHC
jgi:hypothetical protein